MLLRYPAIDLNGGVLRVIIINQEGWYPNLENGQSYMTYEVFDMPHERVSALLGPDGETLMVQYPRRAIGFDLRQKGSCA